MARQIRVAEMDGVDVSILLLIEVKMEGPLRDLACAERANGCPRFASKAGPLFIHWQKSRWNHWELCRLPAPVARVDPWVLPGGEGGNVNTGTFPLASSESGTCILGDHGSHPAWA
jgi:hypothetical protein